MNKPLTWHDLLTFAQSLRPDQLEKPVVYLNGRMFHAQLADEDLIDDDLTGMLLWRSQWAARGDDPAMAPPVAVHAGDPVLWNDATGYKWSDDPDLACGGPAEPTLLPDARCPACVLVEQGTMTGGARTEDGRRVCLEHAPKVPPARGGR